MTEFILNNEHVITSQPTGNILLDFIRLDKHQSGTKIGCREGDCGACTVLVGKLNDNGIIDYKSVTSCITPLGSVHGKHVVTIEGLNLDDNLSKIQSIFKDNNATQCGFCTPGFIVSIAGYSFNKETTIEGITESVSGNICRCTGYKSIEKATKEIVGVLVDNNIKGQTAKLVESKFIPGYFADIPDRLKDIKPKKQISNSKNKIVGGGTDLYVIGADNHYETEISLIEDNTNTNKININNNICTIDAGSTATNILESKELNIYFPELKNFFKLISSKQIRNMGTLGGNIVNASPIADLSIFFIALNSVLAIIDSQGNQRNVFLKDFFKGYKTIDLQEGEIISNISFSLPNKNQLFNFEKVSKRTHLDIASVNSAISIEITNNIISEIQISAGGVSPIPLYLKNTCSFLKGKELSSSIIRKAHCVLKEEIKPISDVRGSDDYKRLLLRQLYFGHFIKLFPNIISISDIK